MLRLLLSHGKFPRWVEGLTYRPTYRRMLDTRLVVSRSDWINWPGRRPPPCANRPAQYDCMQMMQVIVEKPVHIARNLSSNLISGRLTCHRSLLLPTKFVLSSCRSSAAAVSDRSTKLFSTRGWSEQSRSWGDLRSWLHSDVTARWVSYMNLCVS